MCVVSIQVIVIVYAECWDLMRLMVADKDMSLKSLNWLLLSLSLKKHNLTPNI